MSNYTPPDERKIAEYYIPPSEQTNTTTNKNQWHSIRTSHDDIESGLLTQSNLSTPPPPYNHYDDDSDESLLDSCGLYSFKRKIIFLGCVFVLMLWLGMGGMDPQNPMMWWWYGDDGDDSYNGNWKSNSLVPDSGKPRATIDPNTIVPFPHAAPIYNPGPNWVEQIQRADKLKKEERERKRAEKEGEKKRKMKEMEEERRRKEKEGMRRGKMSNRVHTCNRFVLREGELRMDGC